MTITAAAKSLAGSSSNEAVAVGDLNGDTRDDIALVTSSYNSPATDLKLLVYLQKATGGFDAPVIYATSGTYANRPATVAIGDINGDGKNDVVVGELRKGIEVFLQNSSGALSSGVSYSSQDSSVVIIAGIDWGNNTASVVVRGRRRKHSRGAHRTERDARRL